MDTMGDQQYEGVAIIGMAGRFPGAESIEEFWANLVAGKESVSFFSDDEMVAAGLDPTALRRRGRYVPARGVLKEADCFDAAFFGIHPKEAEVMDPQQRVFLETCWAALERAGYAPSVVQGSVGVFAGVTFNTYYLHALHQRPDLLELVGPELVMFGNEKDYLATRVAYKLGLKGPAVNVSTACSTSLVAISQACQSLLTYQCDIALAGGASVRVPQERGYYYDEGNIASADGHTRTFDTHAAGTVFSNGVGVVVLKRLEEAVKDGDQIYAVIKGAAINNDGSQRLSFSAPGVEGQSEVIAMAHALAGVDPETITYVEAHGTATPLGDPIEVAGLTKAFRMGTEAKQFCALGSVKTNIGHLDVAAGVTGLIKTALSLRYRKIPASLHFTQPNSKLNLENSPFYINATLQEWNSKPGVPLRAGVSSFGTGGTNAHVVLEEAPEVPSSGASRPWQLLVLSAKTPDALERATTNLCKHLKQIASETEEPETSRSLADAAFTLQTGRSEFVHRRVVVVRDAGEGATSLEACKPKHVFTHKQQFQDAPVVFMFPGQGAQYSGMGAELYRSESVFRAEIDRCTELLRPLLEADLRTVVFPTNGQGKEAAQLLGQTRFTQPALFVIEYALAKLWMSWGVRPTAMIGHSVGEYVAGCLSGVFSLEDALSLVARRGAMVQAQPGGGMLAIRRPETEILPLLSSEVAIASINSPNLCVVSGPHDAIAVLEKQFADEGIAARRLQTSHAFHSPMMEPVLEPFTELVRNVKLGAPKIPYVSNITARWVTEDEARTAEYWASHMRQTVRFADGIAELMKDPRNLLLEVGPGQTLTTLARQHPAKSEEQVVVSSLPLSGTEEPRGVLEGLGRLWMAGVTVDWDKFYGKERRRRVVLPTYPFERKRYWPEPASSHVEQVSSTATLGTGDAADVSPAPPQSQVVRASPSNVVAISPPAESTPELPRKQRLFLAARSLLQELSGYDLSNVDASATLLELGLDSLLLTQAAQVLQRKFGVSITFRQLMEELGSLDEIAAHLDASLPAEAPAAAPRSAPVAAEAELPAVGAVPNSLLENLLLQQQQLSNQLLQLLGRQTVPIAQAPVIANRVLSPLTTSEHKSHGPFKPIDRSAGAGLSEKQKGALDGLIARYIRRTGGSKKVAAENRPVLADPRSVSGFNRHWKEMVYPIVTTRSEGSRVWDVDGNEYLDFVMGFGASIFGHKPSFVVKAVHEQVDRGFEIGPIQPLAGEVAALIKEFTGMQRVAFTNTGSEAVLAATRVARTVTGRDKIAVFAGAYHGIFDEVLFRPLTVNGETRTAPIAPGIPNSSVEQVIVLEYGDPQSIEILKARGSEIAAVLVEPVQSRRLDFQPKEFMHELRQVTEQTGSALVFDEVVTGFRVHPGGAQAYFGVRADLATYGKVVGGGLPVGVVTGIARFMDALDGGQWQYGDSSFPEVGVTFFAGTFVRHPLVLAAAKAVLLHLKEGGADIQSRLSERTAQLAKQLRSAIDELHAPYHLTQFSSLMHLTFPAEQRFGGLLFYLLRERGIHIYENRAFVLTTAHSDEDLARLVKAFRESVSEMLSAGFVTPSSTLATASPIDMSANTTGQGVRGSVSADQTDLEGLFPLTEAQKEIWVAAQMGGDAQVAYNESLSLQFHGPFDVDLFRASARQIVQRHPILLANLSADGQWQQVKSGVRLDIPLIDVSHENASDAERRLGDIVGQEISGPFDLVSGPLLRVRIVRLSAEHHVVIWTAHHIICDGWSGGLIVSELASIYSASKSGTHAALEEPASFREYALANQADNAVAGNAMEYWRKQFADVPPPLDLPIDHPRPVVRSARASTLKRSLDASLYPKLKSLAGQQRTTLVVLLMAALKTMLSRLSGQTDLVIGLPAAGQALSGSGCLVGHCVNLLPVRSQLDPESSFQKNLAIVKKSVLDAYDHHQCTIGEILQHLKVPRTAGRSPLVEVVFNVDRDPGAAKFQGLQFECDRNAKRALHFDLFFNVVEGPRGLYVECDYNTELFDASTIERWLRHYQTLLESIAGNSSERLDKLAILTAAENAELTIDWNRTEVEFSTEQTLQECFEHQVEKTPQACAVTLEGRRVTYEELNSRANQVAHYLRGLGVGPEVLVGLFVSRSAEMLVGMLGILKAGGAYVPMDPDYPKERLGYILEDSKAPIVLTEVSLAKELPKFAGELICLDTDWAKIARESSHNPASQNKSEQLAYVLFTSGSTGRPKGVALEHRAAVTFVHWAQQVFSPDELKGVLFSTSVCFDLSVFEIFAPLSVGGCVIIAQNVVYLPTLAAKNEVTLINTVPSAIAELEHAGGIPASVKTINLAGEALPDALVEQLYQTTKVEKIYNLYGPTESTTYSTYTLIRRGSPVTIGRPISNTQAYILDSHRNPVPVGVGGELYLGGGGLARGYYGRSDLTTEKFVVHPLGGNGPSRLYRTGDLCRWLPDSNIQYLGRIDYQVKLRGFRIELGEIEATLDRHPGVRQSLVMAREDEPGLKRLVAYVVPVAGQILEAAELRKHVKQSLPEFMVPSSIVFLDLFPLTPNGKINRRVLPAPDAKSAEVKAEFVAPRNSLEQTLALIWAKVLKVKRIGVHDNFFDLGGHSLAAVRLLAEVREQTGRFLPLATLFQASTIAEMAEILRKDGWVPSWSSLVPIQPLGSKPPLFLIHGAEGNVLLYRQLAQHLGLDQPVYGLQSQGLNGDGHFDSSIPEMAAKYIKELQIVQPYGPYFLGGYCLGGTIAFEMAQQLRTLGEKVELVIMLETYNTGAVSRSVLLRTPLHLLQNLWFHCANIVSIQKAKDRRQFLSKKLDIEITRFGIRAQAAYHASLRLGRTKSQHTYPHLMVKQINDEAVMRYLPGPYDGRVVVIRPKAYFSGLTSPSMGWDQVVHGGPEVYELPVYPKGMLIEPFCRSLGETLKQCLQVPENSPHVHLRSKA